MTVLGFRDSNIPQTELTRFPDWNIARGWIKSCIETHTCCMSNEVEDGMAVQPALPTRILDLGLPASQGIRLLETEGHHAEYVTLSHCWGLLQPLTTTSANVKRHLSAIPFQSMPLLFQDAITATRELGFRYLWIDSLCIIQDSKEDWERECSNMSLIYSHSSLTICGPQAADSSHGFLQARTSSEFVPRVWKYQNRGEASKWATWTFIGNVNLHPTSDHYPDGASLSREEHASFFQNRGWILQEYVLSPRVLFFGKFRMYMECRDGLRFEDCEGVKERQADMSNCVDFHTIFRKADFNLGPSPSQNKVSMIWLQLIIDYSRRKLSKSTDKLPAIGAIANKLLDGRGSDYVAGLFKEDMHHGLTWYCCDEGTLHRAPDYRAPSWSWAALDAPVRFMCFKKTQGRVGWVRESKIQQSTTAAQMVIQDIAIKLSGPNPFGEVSAGSIKLKGRVNKGKLQIYYPETSGVDFPIWDVGMNRHIGYFFPDDIEQWEFYAGEFRKVTFPPTPFVSLKVQDYGRRFSKPEHSSPTYASPGTVADISRKIECVCIGYFVGKGQPEISGRWIALVIEPLAPEISVYRASLQTKGGPHKAYRRIGIATSLDNWSDGTTWFHDCPWELIELF
jgi:hypothetical protein